MKIAWWQGGIHIEPENTEERAALMLLWEARRVQPSTSAESVPYSTGEVGVKLLNVGVGDQ
jgi:hypothetical protein